MPTKHIVKSYDIPAFYHVYNRASGERPLFREPADRDFFELLLRNRLEENAQLDEIEPIKTYCVEVIAYCLMGTHFHLLLYQWDDIDAITGYMRSVSTAYSMYYNRKYKSKGHVFQSNFRASHIQNDSYLAHITRYIHLNPRNYASWQWSSYKKYIGATTGQNWVHLERVLDHAAQGSNYAAFVKEWAPIDRRLQHKELRHLLAA